MTVKRKKLRLEFTEEQKGKQVTKSYAYDIAKTTTNEVAKEVGQALASLIKKDIETYTVSTTENL